MHTPVGHVACIGTYLIETSCLYAVNLNVAFGFTVHNLEFSLFHHVARWVDEFHIKDVAEVGLPLRVTACDISLKPYVLAFEVASVVEMQIHFLLWVVEVEVHGLAQVRHYIVGWAHNSNRIFAGIRVCQ